MTKKELVFKVFNNEEADRIPVGFWFHFAKEDEFDKGLEDDSIIRKNIEGHQKFYDNFNPDFLKLMSDGFFHYPNTKAAVANSASELRQIKSIGYNHPWIEKQVELVKELTNRFGKEVATFYNIFAPLTFFSLIRSKELKSIEELFLEDRDALKYALSIIADDIKVLARRVIEEGGADGIYLSVKNIQSSKITKYDYLEIITPSELKVLEEANRVSKNNILHICGYEGARNDLSTYIDYDAKVINWAVTVERVSLKEGKKIFKNKAVIGGFDSRPGSLIHSGEKVDIEHYTEQLLSSTGDLRGIILGADCTIPSDIDLERLDWVRNRAVEFQKAYGKRREG